MKQIIPQAGRLGWDAADMPMWPGDFKDRADFGIDLSVRLSHSVSQGVLPSKLQLGCRIVAGGSLKAQQADSASC
jgi:hypothetical protein